MTTLRETHERVVPGDTVFIRGGIYRLSAGQAAGIAIGKSGMQGNPITFSAHQKKIPALDGSAFVGGGRLCGPPVTGSWLHFKGLDVCSVPAPTGSNDML